MYHNNSVIQWRDVTNKSLDLSSGLPIWWEWIGTVGERKGKGVGERSMVWIACMVGMGREDREGEGKVRG